MNDSRSNPYQPPVARVADFPTDPAKFGGTPRPRVVTIALWLLWAGIAIELINTALGVHAALQTRSTVVIATNGTIALVAGACGLIFMVGRRRNWARITYAMLFALGIFIQVWNWQNLLNGPARDLVSIVLQFGLQLAAVILLFLREADAWFRSRKP